MRAIRSLFGSKPVKTLRGSLNRVRIILQEQQRWLQESLFDASPDGPAAHHGVRTATRCCLAGALEFLAEDHRQVLTDLIITIIEQSEPEFPRNTRTSRVAISEWNDHPGRTHAEVMELIDKALDQLHTMI